VVGGKDKIDFLKARAGLRDAQILLRNPQSFAADLDRALDAENLAGFDLILDSVAGEYFRPGYDRLNPAGRLILFGSATMMTHSARPNYLEVAWRYLRRPRLDPLEMMSANKSLMAFNLIWLWDRVDVLMSLYDSMMRLKLRPPHVGRRFAFERAPEAIAFFQSGASVGKVILEL
jgi:alcohol dehydrogenase